MYNARYGSQEGTSMRSPLKGLVGRLIEKVQEYFNGTA